MAATDVLQRWACSLLGLRVHEAKPTGTVQGKAFRSRDHRLVRTLVSSVKGLVFGIWRN